MTLSKKRENKDMAFLSKTDSEFKWYYYLPQDI